MAPSKDDLMSSLQTYLSNQSSIQNVAAQGTSNVTQEQYLNKDELGMAKQTIETAKKLDKLIGATNKKYREAVDYQIKSNKIMMRTANIALKNQLDNEIKILNVMKEQYKIQERAVKLEALSNKLMGRPATKMMKAAVTGKNALGEEVGMGKRTVIGIGGAMIGALNLTYTGMLAATMKFVTALNKAWDSGIAGVMQVAVDAISGFANLVAPGLGAALGAIGGLFIKMAMMRWEDQIAKTTMGVKMKAISGAEGGQGLFTDMLKITGGVRHLAVEWGNALTETSNRVTKEFSDDFYRLGRTMDLTASETSDYYKKALTSGGEDVTKAQKSMLNLFGASQEMAKKSGISSKIFASAIADAAVSARMFNVDMKSVTNTMADLVSKQKNLAASGMSVRDLPQVLDQLINVPKQWSMSMHAFAGMQMYGKEMGPAKGMIASMLGKTAADTLTRAEGGGFSMKPGKGEGIMENRLKMLTDMVGKQTAGMKDPHTAYVAGLALLEKFGVTGTGARAVLAAKDKGGAISKEAEVALMTQEEIQQKLLTTSDRQEQIQRIIAKLTGDIIGLVYLLPDKVGYKLAQVFGKPTALQKAGAEAFDEKIKKIGESFRTVSKNADPLFGIISEGINDANKLRADKAIGSKEGGKELLSQLSDEIAKGPSLLEGLGYGVKSLVTGRSSEELYMENVKGTAEDAKELQKIYMEKYGSMANSGKPGTTNMYFTIQARNNQEVVDAFGNILAEGQ